MKAEFAVVVDMISLCSLDSGVPPDVVPASLCSDVYSLTIEDAGCSCPFFLCLLGGFSTPFLLFINGASFFGRIQLSSVNSCSAVSCNFGILTGEDEHTSFYSTVFLHRLPCPLHILSDNARLPLPENSSPKSIRASLTASYPYNATAGFMP